MLNIDTAINNRDPSARRKRKLVVRTINRNHEFKTELRKKEI